MPTRYSLFVVFLVAICASNLVVAQNIAGTLESKILALERKWNDAYQRSDITQMDSLLADDFIITIEDGSTYSKNGYIARNGNTTVHVETSDMSDLRVRTHGNTAVVTGAYHEKGTENGKSYDYRDRFTDVWVNTNGKWQVLASHYSLRSSQ